MGLFFICMAAVAFSGNPKEQINSEEMVAQYHRIELPQYYSLGICAGAETKLLVDDSRLDEFVDEYIREMEAAEDEYSNFAIANVDRYVNVRKASDTGSEIVGRMYDGAVAQIQNKVMGEDGEWLEVISGNVDYQTNQND